MNQDDVKEDILNRVKEYFRLAHGAEQTFVPDVTKIGYAGRVFDEREILNLIEASLEFWLTYGRFSKEFEKKLADFLGLLMMLINKFIMLFLMIAATKLRRASTL